ncbi:MAG: gluconate 2-dehydrogenase subunit 3 family protein [Deltaproteobacteria bacterium]
MAIKRRTFVVAGVGTVALGAGTWAWLRERGYDVDPHPAPPQGEQRAPVGPLAFTPFDPVALKILGTVVGILIPGDETLGLPSAVEAGVVEFLVRASALPGMLPVRNDLLKLTRHIDIVAQRHRGVRFDELDDATRRAVIDDVRAGGDKRRTFDPRGALETLLRLSLEGYLGHPRHGGNAGAKTWAALEIDMPRDVEAGHEGHHP